MPLFVIVILVLFIVGDVAWAAYVVSRLRGPGVKGSRASKWGQAIVVAFLLVSVGGLALALTKRATGLLGVTPLVVSMPVFLWHLLVLPITLVVMMLAGAGGTVWGRVRGASKRELSGEQQRPAPPPGGPANLTEDARASSEGMSRRQLLALSAAVAPPLAVVATTGIALTRLHDFRIRDVIVPMPGLPGDLDGLTIAHLADTHLGEFSDSKVYRQFIDATNALKADLIVHTGDVINVDSNDIPEAMDGLSRLSAPLGVFVCEGNHDLIQDPRRFRQEIRKLANVRFLRNDGATVTARGVPVQLLGVRWGTPADPSPDSKVSRQSERNIEVACEDLQTAVRPDAMLRIALAHHPHAFDFAPFAHLTLSGHTHGGQLNLSHHLGFGALMYRYWSGLYRNPEGRALFVSNGVGNWFPLRVNAPAEIVKLTLRKM